MIRRVWRVGSVRQVSFECRVILNSLVPALPSVLENRGDIPFVLIWVYLSMVPKLIRDPYPARSLVYRLHNGLARGYVPSSCPSHLLPWEHLGAYYLHAMMRMIYVLLGDNPTISNASSERVWRRTWVAMTDRHLPVPVPVDKRSFIRGMIWFPSGTANAPEGGRKSYWTSTIINAVFDILMHA